MEGWRAAQSPPDLLTVSTDSDSMASLRLLALAATLALASGETPGLELATKLYSEKDHCPYLLFYQ